MFQKKSKIPKLPANPSTQPCAAAVVPGFDLQPPGRHTEALNAHPLCRLIYPCRSLCEAVKRSCAPVMARYGYPWPEILNCNKFPADHELCIAAVSMDENSSSRRSKSFFSSCSFPYVILKAQKDDPMTFFYSAYFWFKAVFF